MQSAKILVVDDDAVARELLTEALKKEGYEVEAFASGEEAPAEGLSLPPALPGGHGDLLAGGTAVQGASP